MHFSETLTYIGFLATLVESSPVAQITRRADVVSVNGWQYKGCWTEATSSRALTGASLYSDTMTVHSCATFCEIRGFSIFGVEYGRECFCGNEPHAESSQGLDAGCNMACAGASVESCGGPNHLNLYRLLSFVSSTTSSAVPVPTTYVAQGCYSEATTGRALNGKSSVNDLQTIAKCATECKGYKYFGLEYYFECFCGNELQAGSAQVADSDCNYPCTGNANENCGGTWRLSMYSFGDNPAPAAPQPTTTTSTIIATATPVSGLQYSSQGCFSDRTYDRALKGANSYDDAMTVERCAAACGGWSIFGVEYGRECFCGNSLEGSDQVLAAQCNMPCAGDSGQMCGAGDRLSVYKFGAVVASSASSSSTASSTTEPTSLISTAPTTTSSDSTSTAITTSTVIATSSSTTTTSSETPTTTTSSISTTTSIIITTTSSTTTTTTTTKTTTTPSPTPTRDNYAFNLESNHERFDFSRVGAGSATGSMSTIKPRSGSFSYRHYGTGNYASVSQTWLVTPITIAPGTSYIVKFWVYTLSNVWLESTIANKYMGGFPYGSVPLNTWVQFVGTPVVLPTRDGFGRQLVGPQPLSITVIAKGPNMHEVYVDDIEVLAV